MEPNDKVLSHDNTSDVDRECPQCGELSITTYWHHDKFTYGSGDTAATLEVIDLPVRRCGACDLEFLDHVGERLRHEAVCRHLGVLTPAEIRDIRQRFGMTRAAFAELTGFGEATLNRWENGALVQNRANDRYLRLLAIPDVMDRLRDLLSARVPPRSHGSNGCKLRVLTVTETLVRRQESFPLRMVS